MNAPYTMAGSFGGFVFTEAGKRRMRLLQGGQEHLLKVPRILRRRIIGKFLVGQPIRVAITEENDPATGLSKQVVSQVLPDVGDQTAPFSPPAVLAPVPCVIRVCSKQNCWRKGGRELFETLNQELAAHGQPSRVEVRQVGCLDRCKQAPNVDAGNRSFTRCSPHHARQILAQVLGQSLATGSGQQPPLPSPSHT